MFKSLKRGFSSVVKGKKKGKSEDKSKKTPLQPQVQQPEKKPEVQTVSESKTLPVISAPKLISSTNPRVLGLPIPGDKKPTQPQPQDTPELKKAEKEKEKEEEKEKLPEVDPKEILFMERVEKLRARRVKAVTSLGNDPKGMHDIQEMLDAMLVKRRLVKAKLDIIDEKMGTGSGKGQRKKKQAMLDEIDTEIRRILDSASTLVSLDQTNKDQAETAQFMRNYANLDKFDSMKEVFDTLNDTSLAVELGMITEGQTLTKELQKELDKIKEQAAEQVDEVGLPDFVRGLGDKLKEFDSEPGIAALMAERNKLQVEVERLALKKMTYLKRKELAGKIKALDDQIEESRHHSFILKYGFGDGQGEDSAKYAREMMQISNYRERKKRGDARKGSDLSTEQMTEIKGKHDEKLRHTMAVQMGLLKPTDKLESLDAKSRARFDKILDRILNRPGKLKPKPITPSEIEEKSKELSELRNSAIEASPYKADIEKLIFKLKIEQTELDVMIAKDRLVDALPRSRKATRIKELQARLDRMLDASMLANNTDATQEDRDDASKKMKYITGKKFGKQDMAAKRVDKLTRYNSAVQLGFIKQGEPLNDEAKKKIKLVMSHAYGNAEQQGMEKLVEASKEEFKQLEDTEEIKALVAEHRKIHEEREQKKKEYATHYQRHQLAKKAKKLEKEILRLRKIEFAKQGDFGGDEALKKQFEEQQKAAEQLINPNATPEEKKKKTKAQLDIEAKMDEIVSRGIAIKMGIIKSTDELDDEKRKRMDNVVKQASKETLLTVKTEDIQAKISKFAEQHLEERAKMLERINKDEHGGDELLKEVFNRYRKAAAKRRAAQVKLDELNSVLDPHPVEAQKLSVQKYFVEDSITTYDADLRHLLDAALTVYRRNVLQPAEKLANATPEEKHAKAMDELRAKFAQQQPGTEQSSSPGESGKGVKLPEDKDKKKEEAKAKIEGPPKLSKKKIFDKDKHGFKLNLHSMAVSMGFIGPEDKMPPIVKQQMKQILATANLTENDSASRNSLGEELAKKYEDVGSDDKELLELEERLRKCYVELDEVNKKGRMAFMEKRRKLDESRGLEEKIRHRKKILLVQKFGFENDPDGLAAFTKALQIKEAATQKKGEVMQSTAANRQQSIEALNSIIAERDEMIEQVMFKKIAQMLGLSFEGTDMTPSNRAKVMAAIEKVDKQAFVEIAKGKFRETPAYQRLEGKFSQGRYSEILEQRVIHQTGKKDDDLELLEKDEDLETATKVIKYIGVGAKVGAKVLPKLHEGGVKAFGKEPEETPTGEEVQNLPLDIVSGSLQGIAGLTSAITKTMWLVQQNKMNHGRSMDQLIDTTQMLTGYTAMLKSGIKATSTILGESSAIGEQLSDIGIPVVTLVTTAVKMAGSIAQAAQQHKIQLKSQEELDSFEDGYSAGSASDVDSFEILTLINKSAELKGAMAAFDIVAGAFSGISSVLKIVGLFTNGAGAAAAGVFKGLYFAVNVGKKLYSYLKERQQNKQLLRGILSEEKTQAFVQSPAFRSLTQEEQDRVVTESFDAESREHFVNILRITHAMDIKERIDKGQLTQRDIRILRIVGFRFDPSDPFSLKGISVHEVAVKLGYTGKNWSKDLKGAEEKSQDQAAKDKKEKQGEIDEKAKKHAKRGYIF